MKLELAMTVYRVVSWRPARRFKLGRTQHELEASQVESGRYLGEEDDPQGRAESSVREVVRQIAMLGGFLGRKCDGEHGVKILWLGVQRLRDFADGIEHMQGIYNVK